MLYGMHVLAFIILCGSIFTAVLIATVGDELQNLFQRTADLMHGQTEYESALRKLRKTF